MYIYEKGSNPFLNGRIFQGVLYNLEDLNKVPEELQELNFFKTIVPYAFRYVEDINVATEMVDNVLANMLIGLENTDKLAEIGGVKFQNYEDVNKRVCCMLI